MAFTQSGINRLTTFVAKKRSKLKNTVTNISNQTLNLVHIRTPVRTGLLKSNITMDMIAEDENNIHYGIGNIPRMDKNVVTRWYAEVAGEHRKAEYSYWRSVEFGTISHPIATRSSETLMTRFGEVPYGLKLPPRYPQRVSHPGYTGARMFRSAIEDLNANFSRVVRAFMTER